ncbi:MAG: helix-turn-helix domain-containing protein [Bacteroidales bacterium]|nr:helix-turn-helix domain-containing protein [Bacteroidales bacterium]
MNIINTIILIGAVQGYFLSVLILSRKRVFHHKLFSLILVFIATALTIAYFNNIADITKTPFLVKINILFPLIFFPLLLIYIRRVTGLRSKNWRLIVLLFLPLTLIILYNIPFYFGSAEVKIDYYYRSEVVGNLTSYEMIEEILVELSLTIIGLLAVREVNGYRNRVGDYYSDHSKVKLGWLYLLSYSMFILSFFAFILSLVPYAFQDIPAVFHFITAIASTVIVYYIAYFLLLHPAVLNDVSENISKTVLPIDQPGKIEERSKKELVEDYENRIIELLEGQGLFKNPEITINDLSQKLGIPVYLVSRIINQRMSTNFYNLINHYRLEQVKTDLVRFPEMTIIEIAYQAGFNSKTSFYEFFRKRTGTTPSEFVMKARQAEQPDKN